MVNLLYVPLCGLFWSCIRCRCAALFLNTCLQAHYLCGIWQVRADVRQLGRGKGHAQAQHFRPYRCLARGGGVQRGHQAGHQRIARANGTFQGVQLQRFCQPAALFAAQQRPGATQRHHHHGNAALLQLAGGGCDGGHVG